MVAALAADTELIALKASKVQGYNHLDKADAFGVDKAISEVSAGDYDGLVLPGGVANPNALRTDSNVVNFIRDFFSQRNPVAAICHAPWTLV